MTRALIIVGVVIVLVYLFGRVAKDQVDAGIVKQVEQVQEQLQTIVEAGQDHYRPGAETRDGVDPWKVEFQFERVDKLWPDLFAIVEDKSLQPTDPFDPEEKPYLIATKRDTILLLSVGPDRLINVSAREIEKSIDEDTLEEKTAGEWAYSPENGTRSSGDLFYLGEYKS